MPCNIELGDEMFVILTLISSGVVFYTSLYLGVVFDLSYLINNVCLCHISY